ncbi:hypothetical protein [Rothia mucilaginosa]|uniref:hypothetical protein n=1 Tax=Rothia mucilaginosa TaxID=43675 RepID=UPI0028DBFD47|nr:hypothetical protein [Rothia mucilaginosa]
MGKEFYLRVNIHPALLTAVISRRVEPQIQGRSGRVAQGPRAPPGSTPVSTFYGDARWYRQAVVEAVYPQLFEKWREKFKKYEHLSLYKGDLLSFSAF